VFNASPGSFIPGTADERPLLRLLSELGPYLPHVVLIGGWVPYLYRRHGGFPNWNTGLSLTQEADVLLTPAIAGGNRPPLAHLLRSAGFQPTSGAGTPAVWESAGPLAGRLELLMAHEGPAVRIGSVGAVTAQAGLGAVVLPGLSLLAEFSRILPIPMHATVDDVASTLNVRLPTLGAYVVNKAATFTQRSSTTAGANPKAGKDIVYLRDVMAGGSMVREQVALDIAPIISGNRSARSMASSAANAVHNGLDQWPKAPFAAAVSELAEREGIRDLTAAAADLVGHLLLLDDLIARARAARRKGNR